ncbi:hypothetical protein [Streptomyces sp. I05A-00742]|uniref:hypothetical protein n=1 Tax=Streptomyces sp. I05A-00742 TaxID=2732853 RepID=UPI0014879FCA|nr:hypothetical protein [Streptomyces sp. I05A-00742]
MGLDISVLIVDWKHLAETPPGERRDLLTEAAYPDDYDDLLEDDFPRGWIHHPTAVSTWSALYEFHSTSGSFKAHFWAGERWEDVRDHAVPELREALDTFLSGLFWELYDPEAEEEDDRDKAVREFIPRETGRRSPWLLVARPPEDVPALAAAWAVAEPLLDGLKGPFTEHADAPGRWIANHEEFAVLLREWAEVVREAHERGWGIVGLPI